MSDEAASQTVLALEEPRPPKKLYLILSDWDVSSLNTVLPGLKSFRHATADDLRKLGWVPVEEAPDV